jgi:hypothetical protein
MGCGLIHFMGCQSVNARRGALMRILQAYRALVTAYDCRIDIGSILLSLTTQSLPLILWTIANLREGKSTVSSIRNISKLSYAYCYNIKDLRQKELCVFCNDIDEDRTTCSQLNTLISKLSVRSETHVFLGLLDLYREFHQFSSTASGTNLTYELIERLYQYEKLLIDCDKVTTEICTDVDEIRNECTKRCTETE